MEAEPSADGRGDVVPQNRIGPYRILDTLGEGGMGIVYLAEQQEPVKLRVALKLVKLGMDSKAVVARFEQERQALALMHHDGIAKVFHCGTSERGQPYFVMELVKGIPLTQFCEQNRLPLAQRLVLMQQVCAAVQHAHQKGVVHRDLKPSNVLVSDDVDKLQVKVIDFGLAKATGKKLVEATQFTEAGQVVGTPEYMAPEQADPTNQDIDTRADIYSLGVMLYELLVGSLPFPGNELRKAGMLEVQRILREVEPPKPSTRLQSSADTVAEVAAARRMSAGALVKVLKHDLNWVALKALEKDRNRRYPTANALAADLQRFLDHEPLVAGPPSAGYRLRKLVRRHRGQVLAAGAVMVALFGGGVGTFVQYLRAEDRAADALVQKGIAESQERIASRRAEDNEKLAREKGELAAAEAKARAEAQENARAAEQRARELEQVLVFQEAQWAEVDSESMGLHLRRSLLASAKEERRGELEANLFGVNFTSLALGMLRTNLFDRSLTAIGKGFADQPLVKARLLQTVADILRDLGLLDRAVVPQTEALGIRRRVLGDDHTETLRSLTSTGLLLKAQGRFGEAEPFYREALAKRRWILGGEHPDTLASLNNMGSLLFAQGKLTEAELFHREALALRRQVLGDDHPSTLTSISNLSLLLESQGKVDEAASLCLEVLARSRRILGEDHPDTLSSLNNMGSLLKAQGNFVEADRHGRDALERRRRTLGDDHPSTLTSMNNVGLLLMERGELAEAGLLLQEALQKRRAVLGDDHPSTLTSVNNQGLLLQAQRQLDEAEAVLRDCLKRRLRILGADHPSTLRSTSNLAGVLRAQGRLGASEELSREAVEQHRRILGDDHRDTLIAVNNLGAVLRVQRKFSEAESLHREVLEKRRRTCGDDHPDTLSSLHSMGLLLHAQGKLREAETYYREAVERRRQTLGDDHPDTLTSISNMAALHQSQRRFPEALTLAREVMERRQRMLGSDHADTVTSIYNLAIVIESQGETGEAERLYREVLQGRRRLLGEDHPDTLDAIHSLGFLLRRGGRNKEAVEVLASGELAVRRVHVGANSHRIASFLRTLGTAYAGLAEPRELALAEAKLQEAHAISTKVRGPAHRDTRDCIEALIRLYEVWHVVEPAGGHDKQVAEWQARLAGESVKEASK